VLERLGRLNNGITPGHQKELLNNPKILKRPGWIRHGRDKGVSVEPNNHHEKKHCPHCQVLVIFDEIHTRYKMATGQQKKKVAVFRCPKCKKIVTTIVPLDQ